MKILILGAGSFGCSLANVVSDNNHEVYLWGYNHEDVLKLEETRENPYIKGAKLNGNIKLTSDLKLVNVVDMVVYVVPSFALRQTSQNINDILEKEQDFVIATKGLEAETMKSGYQIVKEEIKKARNVSVLSGPTHAEELAFGKYTAIVSTCPNEEFAKKVQKVFTNSYLRVYTNNDLEGVELVGAAKNVLAIAAGVCDSHPQLGDNAKAALLTRGLREILLIGEAEGNDAATFHGLTGLGDLIVTATSQHSRNRKFGELLGQGLSQEEAKEKIGMVVEGLYSVDALHRLNLKNNLNLPIIEGIYRVIYENENVECILENMFNRELKSEN